MKKIIMAILIMLGSLVNAQSAPKRIALTPASTVPLAIIASDLGKQCSNVVLTMDISKADYLLDARTLEGAARADGAQWERWEYTLIASNGDILFHTETTRSKNAIKDVCKFIGAKKMSIAP